MTFAEILFSSFDASFASFLYGYRLVSHWAIDAVNALPWANTFPEILTPAAVLSPTPLSSLHLHPTSTSPVQPCSMFDDIAWILLFVLFIGALAGPTAIFFGSTHGNHPVTANPPSENELPTVVPIDDEPVLVRDLSLPPPAERHIEVDPSTKFPWLWLLGAAFFIVLIAMSLVIRYLLIRINFLEDETQRRLTADHAALRDKIDVLETIIAHQNTALWDKIGMLENVIAQHNTVPPKRASSTPSIDIPDLHWQFNPAIHTVLRFVSWGTHFLRNYRSIIVAGTLEFLFCIIASIARKLFRIYSGFRHETKFLWKVYLLPIPYCLGWFLYGAQTDGIDVTMYQHLPAILASPVLLIGKYLFRMSWSQRKVVFVLSAVLRAYRYWTWIPPISERLVALAAEHVRSREDTREQYRDGLNLHEPPPSYNQAVQAGARDYWSAQIVAGL